MPVNHTRTKILSVSDRTLSRFIRRTSFSTFKRLIEEYMSELYSSNEGGTADNPSSQAKKMEK
jgi:hypothetical protein